MKSTTLSERVTRESVRDALRIQPRAANDNDVGARRPGETFADAADRLRAIVGGRVVSTVTPWQKEIRERRVPVALEVAAAMIEDKLERATRTAYSPTPSTRANDMIAKLGFAGSGGWHPCTPTGAEVTVDLMRDLDGIRAAAGRNWRAIEMALLERATMMAIGMAYGAPKKTAAPLGREHVLDGLRAAYEYEFGHPADLYRFGPVPANDNTPAAREGTLG